MVVYTIYKSLNTKNGKVYIGFDSNWPSRVGTHKNSYPNSDTKFYRAIRKYGWDAFEWSSIYQSKDKDHTLKIMESLFITEYNSFHEGYNSTLGGDGTFGFKLLGEKNSFYGKKHTNETKQKISKKNSGKNNGMYGKNVTSETREKLSNALRGRKFSDGWKEKISNSLTGRKVSEECKNKLKEAKRLNKEKGIKPQYKQKTCPHCGKTGVSFNMTRYHFDNCKTI
jgi:group I intron endonuclease